MRQRGIGSSKRHDQSPAFGRIRWGSEPEVRKTDVTTRKRFKRLVRARMAKTGESYTTALRYFRDRSKETDAMLDTQRIVKADLGFSLGIPGAWEELPPKLTKNRDEAARFREDSERWSAACLVFFHRSTDEQTPHQAAERAKIGLHGSFQNFKFEEIAFAGRSATRLEFDSQILDPSCGGVWSVWEHFVKVDGHMLCFGWGTSDIESDRELFEQIATSVELHDPADSGNLSEMALFRYSEPARRVIDRAGRMAEALGEHTLQPKHLLYSLALTEEGDAVPVMLKALGIVRGELPIPETSEEGAGSKSDVLVGEDLYALLTLRALEMGHTFVKPVDILSALVSAMPESVSALGR